MIKYVFCLIVFINLAGCAGCSKSRGERKSRINQEEISKIPKKTGDWSGTTTVYMNEENGIYKIPVLVNGSKMDFIFDTGASLISISNTEAMFLYKQGTLTQDDFIGEINFQDANGDISPGTVVRLRTLQIGDRVLENVEASIVNNSVAPLLLGQSALAQFGKISIDYNRKTISFQ
ncbi:MAG: retroviral-like aspartic protease family protein [Arcicella sp.]|jgi:aspartyl protease family protein|nr:retroviral-like aspartic protease family protein [Arcicella sp.]